MSSGITLLSVALLVLILFRDWGHRKASSLALLRPLLAAVVVVPFVAPGWDTGGGGLALEIGAVVLGAAIGLAAFACMHVTVDADGQAWTRTGYAYAAIWVALTAARQLFIYGCQHWFTRDLGSFLVDNHVGVHAFADAIMFLTLAPITANRLAVLLRIRTLRSRAAHRPAEHLADALPAR